jgi:hypothetical protein
MTKHQLVFVLFMVLFATAFAVVPALAHQPYFEDQDIVAGTPWVIDEPNISTAVYSTLESTEDVDYYAFQGSNGQEVYISLTIPQIEGQADFAPDMALMGPGLPPADLPPLVVRPEGAGAIVIPHGPATAFYEPYSRTSYWNRQEQRIILPADGQYVVAVWHPQSEVGRYVFVVGEEEIPGGDPAAREKLPVYWTPVPNPTPTPESSRCNQP